MIFDRERSILTTSDRVFRLASLNRRVISLFRGYVEFSFSPRYIFYLQACFSGTGRIYQMISSELPNLSEFGLGLGLSVNNSLYSGMSGSFITDLQAIAYKKVGVIK